MIVTALLLAGAAFVRSAEAQALPRVRAMSPQDAPGPRAGHSAVWTGHEMLIWGGDNSLESEGIRFNDGAAYEPTRNRWRALSTTNAPQPRSHHTAVWTGRAMVIWGGSGVHGELDDGGTYEPLTRTWRALPRQGALSPRQDAVGVWTGHELILWGGSTARGERLFGDGARWRPGDDHWRTMAATRAPSPRSGAVAIWTGREVVIWGGRSAAPGSKTLNDGAAYDPASDQWRRLSLIGAPAGRIAAAGLWTGREVLIWGGKTSDRSEAACDGAAYDPRRDTWRTISARDCLSRDSLRAVWTQRGLLVVGETNSDAVYPPREGALLPNGESRWRNFPVGFGWNETAAVWTGRDLLMWGGFDGTNVVGSGVKIRP